MRTEIIGDCTLHLGDSEEILCKLPDVHVVVTDPPYGLDCGRGTLGKRGRAAKVTWPDTPADVRNKYVPIVVAALALANGRGIITPGQMSMFLYPAPRDVGAIVQPCAVGVSPWGRATWQPVLFYGEDPHRGEHLSPVTVTHNQPTERVDHPTPKPLVLVEWMVGNGSSPNEIVLDPFMGSGTTGVACINLARRFIGIESNTRYFDIACKRIDQANRQGRMQLDSFR